jgi:hypothetical protein
VSVPRITYIPRPDATQQGELDTLANVYRFILQKSRASNEGGPGTAPDDVKESNGHVATQNRSR